MSLTSQPTLDFSELRTPPDDGDVLVAPGSTAWIPAARANHEALRDADTPLLGSTLGDWRRRTREAITGRSDRLIVVTGHQPAFIHPGVWAKHIAAARFAKATCGTAINLVVDSDVPKRTTLAIATETDGRIALKHVPFADLTAGQPYEQIPLQSNARIAQFREELCAAMGPLFDRSQASTFLDGMRSDADARDWVDQAVAGRRAVESKFGIVVDDRRISRCYPGPLLADMLSNAPRFVASYNAALAEYRNTNRIRGTHQPIPDLQAINDRYELPVWAWRRNDCRHRLFVSRKHDIIRLFADESIVGEISVHSLDTIEKLAPRLGTWQLRPRALTLTIWARLLLADLFVHGIGGAKYDRISDRILADYYGVVPPHMACVSATLMLDLPQCDASRPIVASLRHDLRDFRFNPQRHLTDRTDLIELIARRAQAVEHAAGLRTHEPRNHSARRQAFEEIRRISALMVKGARRDLEARQSELAHAITELEQASIARGRDYFFGLYRDQALHKLMDALPSSDEFRV